MRNNIESCIQGRKGSNEDSFPDLEKIEPQRDCNGVLKCVSSSNSKMHIGLSDIIFHCLQYFAAFQKSPKKKAMSTSPKAGF